MNGNYGNGNNKGTVTYKIRKNDGVQGFDKKLQDVNITVVSHFKGGNVKDIKVNKNRKPM
jgi:hypothetical protein